MLDAPAIMLGAPSNTLTLYSQTLDLTGDEMAKMAKWKVTF